MQRHEIDVFDDDRDRRRMFQEFDQAIREANRAAISAATGPITKDHVLRVAIAVSQLRARYLKEVLRLTVDASGKAIDPALVTSLHQMREAYEEALNGFGALRHALERGYIDLPAAAAPRR